MGGLLGGMHALRSQASRNNELLSNQSLSMGDDHYRTFIVGSGCMHGTRTHEHDQ